MLYYQDTLCSIQLICFTTKIHFALKEHDDTNHPKFKKLKTIQKLAHIVLKMY